MTIYRVDPARSRATVDATSSVHPIHSETDGLTGWLELQVDDAGRPNLRSRKGAEISLEVERLRSGNPLEDRELRRQIDARRYPTITGAMRSMRSAGSRGSGGSTDSGSTFIVGGDVTLRGVTRAHEGLVTIDVWPGGEINVRGAAVFDVREFGIEPPRILMLRVHPEVTVSIDVIAVPDA